MWPRTRVRTPACVQEVNRTAARQGASRGHPGRGAQRRVPQRQRARAPRPGHPQHGGLYRLLHVWRRCGDRGGQQALPAGPSQRDAGAPRELRRGEEPGSPPLTSTCTTDLDGPRQTAHAPPLRSHPGVLHWAARWGTLYHLHAVPLAVLGSALAARMIRSRSKRTQLAGTRSRSVHEYATA